MSIANEKGESRARRTSRILVAAFALGLCAPAFAHRIEKRFSVEMRPVVTVRNAHGQILVKSWKRPEVLVIGAHASDKVEVDVEQAGNRIDVVTHILKEDVAPADLRTDYEITVPEESELQVRSDSGIVIVERVFGDMTFDTVAADLQLQEVAGYLMVKTTGGSLICVRCAGRIEVNTISGHVRLIQPVSSNVRAQTLTGNIFFDGDFLNGGIYILKNSSGVIEVRFSEGDSFDLTATSIQGTVVNQAKLRPPAHSRHAPGARFSRGLFGPYSERGARVELTSFSGTIKILKRE